MRDARWRPHTGAIHDAYASRAETLLEWLESADEAAAIAIGVAVPALRELLLERLAARETMPSVLYAALREYACATPQLVERAATDLRTTSDPHAAAFVVTHGTVDSELAPLVERALPSEVALRLRVDPRAWARAMMAFDTALEAGTVVFAGPKMVVVKTEATTVTLRWADSGLLQGAEVRVGRGAAGDIRSIQVERAAGVERYGVGSDRTVRSLAGD